MSHTNFQAPSLPQPIEPSQLIGSGGDGEEPQQWGSRRAGPAPGLTRGTTSICTASGYPTSDRDRARAWVWRQKKTFQSGQAVSKLDCLKIPRKTREVVYTVWPSWPINSDVKHVYPRLEYIYHSPVDWQILISAGGLSLFGYHSRESQEPRGVNLLIRSP